MSVSYVMKVLSLSIPWTYHVAISCVTHACPNGISESFRDRFVEAPCKQTLMMVDYPAAVAPCCGHVFSVI